MTSPSPHAGQISRRRLLQASGITAATIALGVNATSTPAAAAPPERGDLFSLGVASGSPQHDSMVLWTRLAPEPLAEDGHGGMPIDPVAVHWEVSTDPGFRGSGFRGRALAQPELAHSVHPKVTGLEPNTEYWYRFRSGRTTSPVGRFRTLPAPGSSPESFSFATTTCQAWYHGHFTVQKHIAAETDLDLVFFLGDYIYEYGINSTNHWREGSTVTEAHSHEIETLEQYRLRYSLTKSDKNLQALHARCASVVTWDDHEVQNDYTGGSSAYDIPDELFAHRIAVAYRAFYENLPIDVAALPEGTAADLTDELEVGDLASFSVLDTRQFRDRVAVDREDQYRPDRTMLGTAQEAWITKRFGESTAIWNVLANGVTVWRITESRTDQWDGFPAARQRLLDALATSRNGVVLTGDTHRHTATELRRNFDDPTVEGNVGVELICSSATSGGDGTHTDDWAKDWLQHDWVKMYDGLRGYVHVTLDRKQMVSTFLTVEWVRKDDTAPRLVHARFITPAGAPALHEA